MIVPYRVVILIVLCGALVAGLFIDLGNTWKSGSIDLRNRVTGWRLLQEGIDPFHHKWSPDQPDIYLDLYNNPAVAVSKTTVTPTFLLLHAPVAAMNYRYGQFAWLLIQWGCLLGAVLLWWRCLAADRHGSLWFVVLVVAFTFTAGWRLHAERGQSYVVMMAVMAVWLTLSLRPARGGWSPWLAGAAAGLLVALRPPLLVVVAPVLMWRLRAQWAGFVAAMLVCAGVPMLRDASCWADYARGMAEWSRLYRENINPRPGGQALPEFVEGIPLDQVGRFVSIPFADASVFYVLRKAGVSAALPALPVLAAFVALAGVWFWRARRAALPSLLAGSAALAYGIDFFLPALRNNYNDVLALNVAALGLVALRPSVRFWPLALSLAGAAAGIATLAFTWRDPAAINLSTLLFAAAVLAVLLAVPVRETAPAAAADDGAGATGEGRHICGQ